MKKGMKVKISRRDFLKTSVLGAAGMGLAYLGLKDFFGKDYSLTGLTVKGTGELSKHAKEAYNYIQFGNNVKCQLCPHTCVLKKGERGRCRVRENVNGKLYSMVYGNPCSVHTDPIEKKPLYHFLPGTTAYSIATAGCNFRCLNCQNWNISQVPPEETKNVSMFPEQVVKNAQQAGAKSIAYTYSEPSVFYEYMLDTSKLAKKQGLKNVWVTNGYMNEAPLRELCKYLDAANVDFKGYDNEFYTQVCQGTVEPVLRTLKLLKEEGVWFEITMLIIPTLNDNDDKIKKMCDWLVENIGPNNPLHLSRFHPDYKLTHLPATPLATLEKSRRIALESGLKHVFIGNVAGADQNTYCSNGDVCVERKGYTITTNLVKNGVCEACGERIAGVWL
jgi:pyruvate formate lyase activating enzyme